MAQYSDPLDQAAATQERFTQESIEAARKENAKDRLIFTGRCHNCEDPVEHPHRFCPGGECLEDWEKRRAAKRRNGS